MHRVSDVGRPGVALAVLACALAAPQARAQSRVANPFDGADGYVSPDYAASVASSAAQVSDATLKKQMSYVATQPTAFWIDRIAAIQGSAGRMGLAAHLDAALAQQKSGKPVVVIAVIYNLPGRDCSALSSNGELGPTEIDKYKSQYIDPIAAIEGSSKYASLRIVNIIEIDSLPNIVTNVNGKPGATDLCNTMLANGNYVKGIQYALGKLHAIANVYNYIDAAHHGWIGWDDNFGASAQMFYDTAKGAPGGVDTVQGFITNTANYSALVEPFITITEQTRNTKWIDWNRYADERSFAVAFRNKLVSVGFSSSIGMLIDTSRNGWGGPARPTKASTSSDMSSFVNESRIDRRIHAGNWCNQSGAGLGERPRVVGADGIHAYVWVKPPGESDGASKQVDNNEGKGVDGMCVPTYTGNARNGNSMSGALPDAPLSGKWFHAQFVQLVQNAYPPVPGDGVDPTPTPIGDFQLIATPSSLMLNQGESASSTLVIGASGGFTGAVSLSASGLPNGVTATFSPASTEGQSTLTLSASSSATLGGATVTLTGTSGSLSRTKTLNLTVNAAGSPSFSLSAAPSSISIDRGATRDATLTVQPAGGFSSGVVLSAEGLPQGVNARFNPQSTSSSSTITFSVSPTAPAGSASVTIVGTSSSPSLTKSTTVALTVNPSGGSAGFSLSATPASIIVRRGSSTTANVSVTELGGFTGSVSLSTSGAPSGVSIAFGSASASAASPSTVTVTAASTAILGTHEIALQGVSGSITGATTLWVTVMDAPSNGGDDAGTSQGADGGGNNISGAGGLGCGTTGPGDVAFGALILLAAMLLRVRRRACEGSNGVKE